MHRLDLQNLAASMSYVGGSLKMMEINRTHILMGQVPFQSIDTDDYAGIVKAAQLVETVGQQLKMASTMAASRRAQNALQTGFRGHGRYDAQSLGPLISALAQLLTTVVDELGERHVIGVDARGGALLEIDGPPLGPRVAAAFPSIQNDLSEAAACRALERPTAAVFHLMRAMEAAVQALATHLGIDGVTREWGKLLSDMNRAIEAMPKGPVRDAWSENHSLLYHVKQAWRNDVMHPHRHYTLIEAERIYDAVASYLDQLAELVPSSPNQTPTGGP